ncbi:MAG: alpha/beta fold hydrolase [Verrucomicrobiales bacterium]
MNSSFPLSLATPAIAALAILSLSSCAKYASLKESTPPFKPATPTGGSLTTAAKTLETALKIEKRNPADAIGQYLDVAHAASQALKRHPQDPDALAAYNYALSRAFGVLYEVRDDPWAEPLEFPGMAGRWQVVARPDPRPNWKPSLYKFLPADEFELSGKYVRDRKIKAGLGAALVTTYRDRDATTVHDRFAQGKNLAYGTTAIVRFSGNRCEVSFEDPLATETVDFQGHRFPLAADFTAPLAMVLVLADPQKLELSRLINPGKYSETARLARLQPYDPKKIPILCVHGLKDSPATWTPLINALRADPEIRKHYQIWFYSYPSGYPYPHSAAIFRKQMDAIKAAYPDHKDVVLIGHSMGGCISRAMITDADDKIWNTMFSEQPDATRLDRDSVQLLRDALIFDARDDVGRVIFIAAPHRGSDLASNWVGRIGSRLVRAPKTLVHVGSQLKNVMTLDASAVHFKRMPNSVDTLSPDNRFVKAINTLPIAPGIPYHSIVGDRGKGGNRDQTKPVSSDGIVPYWSSHLDGAESELVVPSNHSAHQNAMAIEEVRRILKEHVRP